MNSPTQTTEIKPVKQSGAAGSPGVSVAICPTVIPQGDGSFIVKAGKPVSLLNAVQLASYFGVDRDTVYRWKDDGIIPETLVEFAGKRKLLFRAELVEILQSYFRAVRGDTGLKPLFKSGARSARLLGIVHGFVIIKPVGENAVLLSADIWQREWKPDPAARKNA